MAKQRQLQEYGTDGAVVPNVPSVPTSPEAPTPVLGAIVHLGSAGHDPMAVAAAREAASAEALVKAAYTAAMMHPRNFDEVRQKVLRACSRPRFAADKSTIYKKPVGGGSFVTGIGIRLAEELARDMGNLLTRVRTEHEDSEKLLLSVEAIDLETNFTANATVRVEKVIERKSVRDGQEVIGQRQTSQGHIVYRVRPTDEELTTKINAGLSKALRNCILRCVPHDLAAEAQDAIRDTRAATDAKDPDAARKDICDAFAQLNVMPSDLERFLGCPIAQASPAQIGELREVWAAVKDGEATFAEFLDGSKGGKTREKGKLDMGTLSKPKSKNGGGEPDTSELKESEIPQE